MIAHNLEADGAVCAIGTVGKARGIDMEKIDPEDYESVAGVFGVIAASNCTQEIVYINDEYGPRDETAVERFARVRKWIVASLLNAPKDDPDAGHVRA